MKSKIKFKAITHELKKTSFTKVYDHPYFEDYHIKEVIGHDVSSLEITRSKSSQILERLDEIDKTELMYQKDLKYIIDYEVVKEKSKNKINYILPIHDSLDHSDQRGIIDKLFKEKNINVPDQMKLDFIAVYLESFQITTCILHPDGSLKLKYTRVLVTILSYLFL